MSPRNGLAPSLHGFSLPVFGRFFAAQAAFVSLQMGGEPRWRLRLEPWAKHTFSETWAVCAQWVEMSGPWF